MIGSISAIDLFCGAGGLTYSFEKAGLPVKVGYDIDPTCKFPYEHNNSAKFVIRDVGCISKYDLEQHFSDTKKSGETYPAVYGRMEWDQPSPTITTQCFGFGNGRFGHPEQDRAISLREAALLQTFPPIYEFVDSDKPVIFDQIGRLVGNAVPVKLGQAIAQSILKHVENFT
jgi:site-specific DNA-cytosine methylase